MGGDLTSSRDDDDAPPSAPMRAASVQAMRRAPSPEPQGSPRLFHVDKNVSATDNIFKKSEAAAASSSDADVGTLSRGASVGAVQVKKENCVVCGKSVYFSDKAVADGKVFHKTCLRCKECNKVLTLGNYSALEGTLYCKPHFLQLFKAKGGNYTEGFGLEDAKKNWAPLAAPAKFGGMETIRKPLASSDPPAGNSADDGEAVARAQQEERARSEERARQQAEERERARVQAEERARVQAEERARMQAEERAKAQAQAQARAKAEADAAARADAAAEAQASSAAEQRAQAAAAQALSSAQQRLAEARRVLADAEAAEAEAERRLSRADALNKKADSLEQRLAKAEAERDALKAEVERLKSGTLKKEKPALPVKSQEAQAAFAAISAIDELDELEKLFD